MAGESNTKNTRKSKNILNIIGSPSDVLSDVGWAGRSAEDRLLCKQEAMGSNPIRSTTIFHRKISLTTPQKLVGKNVDMIAC